MEQPTWDDTVSRVYREAIADQGPEGADRQLACDTAAGRLRKMIEGGVIDLPIERAIRAELMRADERDSRRADNVIKRLLSGTGSLFTDEGDPILDLVVTLGKGRRKAWRDVTDTDLADMTALRQGNVRSAVLSFDEWRNDVAAALPVVVAHGTIGAAVHAGAFKNLEVAA